MDYPPTFERYVTVERSQRRVWAWQRTAFKMYLVFIFAISAKILDELQYHWNTYYIRKSHEHVLGGKAVEIYYLPEAFGFTNCRNKICSKNKSNIFDEEWLHNEIVPLECENKQLFTTFVTYTRSWYSLPSFKMGERSKQFLILWIF